MIKHMLDSEDSIALESLEKSYGEIGLEKIRDSCSDFLEFGYDTVMGECFNQNVNSVARLIFGV